MTYALSVHFSSGLFDRVAAILKVVSILGEHRKRGKDTPDKVSEKIMCV